ncbi:MAG: BrnA antitoxin family protein [Maritimibacter sp.]
MTWESKPRRTLTRSERLAWERLGKRSLELYYTPIWVYDLKREVPAAWAVLEQDIDVEEPKVKVTIRLDESVAKYFRAMGKGYQERINRVLATYAQMQIARVNRVNAEIEAVRDGVAAGKTMQEALDRSRR